VVTDIPSAITVKNPAFCTYRFGMILRVNSISLHSINQLSSVMEKCSVVVVVVFFFGGETNSEVMLR
jgi:hypothetical protein